MLGKRNPETGSRLEIPIYFLRVEIEITRGKDIFERLVDLIAQPRHVTQGLVSSELVETSE